MRVCLNALYFNSGRMGGVETYLRELIRQLPDAADNDAFFIFANPRFKDEFAGNDAITVVTARMYERPDPRWFISGFMRRGLGIDVYASELARVDADLIHYPFTVLAPMVIDRPTVLTFWDMQHEFYPEYFNKRDLELRDRTYRKSAQMATRVIASSQFTRKCLIERYSLADDRIDVIYTGYSPEYRFIRDDSKIGRLKNHYGLDRPFMFYPAAIWPHKNHGLLLDALKLLVDRGEFDGMLVLSGIQMQRQNELAQKVNSLGLENHVKNLGYLPYGELPYIFTMARLLVFPSLFEGFGLPLVEAMACGCPVAASNMASIPEVLGDAGKLFDPASAEDIAATVLSIWNDEQQLAEMSKKGLERANRFKWEDTARKTLDVYHKALDQG